MGEATMEEFKARYRNTEGFKRAVRVERGSMIFSGVLFGGLSGLSYARGRRATGIVLAGMGLGLIMWMELRSIEVRREGRPSFLPKKVREKFSH